MLLSIAQLPFSAKSPVPLRSPQGLADDRIPRFFSPPPKKPSTREREYLRTDEIKAMIRAAKKVGRHGVRDGGIILLMFRHGLRTPSMGISSVES